MECKVPSLVDLCVQLAIDNISHLGNVGETDFQFLERILPHCNIEQLIHVEDCSKDRDLSPVTDKLWKNFFMREFGSESINAVVGRMKQKNTTFKWRELYETKAKIVEVAQEKSFERVRQRYVEEKAKKRERSVQICTKLPPASSKRFFYGGPSIGISSTRSSIMKKAKVEFLRSPEVKNLAAVKNKAVQRNPSMSRNLGVSSSMASSSASRISKPGMSMSRNLGVSSSTPSSSASRISKPGMR